MIRIEDADRVRTITLDRPEALNAFNEALYDATTEALIDAAADPTVAVVVLTGAGRAFSAGTDLIEMAQHNSGTKIRGEHGFGGMVDRVQEFPKPLLIAVNGLGLGIGATILGFADLAFMADTARLKCPFTSLAVAPEAASSVTFPRLLGRQNAMWALLSSEWLSAAECLEMGLVFKVCPADELLDVTMRHARILAAKSIPSLIESKRAVLDGLGDQVARARRREDAAFGRLLGRPANIEALTAFAERREPDFAAIDAREG
ncbi:enoyl-CoA hydratase/isomerase family protein [Embleya scabrispora]|uniref:enoyl-CoA hydratase/isomerase family protein n=1 Tax=Embleya scabrispora TaxID=159449 RepID=UPI0003769FA9|nr:enoyl-CoA hydratase-related protein [Embleya scabrispora]MYS82318.1 enoyl-CoA hydratase/isomerase family protein [Streptomyces sp. SID5474]